MLPVPPRMVAGAVAVTALMMTPAFGQVSPSAPAPSPAAAPVAGPTLDPASPMAPLPDLGVAWPDLNAAASSDEKPSAAATADSDAPHRYRIDLKGADAVPGFTTRFNQLSALHAGENKPANSAQINLRAKEDEDLARQILRSIGRYDGSVESRISADPDQTATVHLTVDPGPAYTFAAITFPGIEAAGPRAPALRDQFAVKQGDTVDADKVNAATIAFRAALTQQGYPFATVADPQVTADHITHQATLAMAVTLGSAAKFGQLRPVGPRQLFTAHHLNEIARFHPGQPYNSAKLDDFRRALIATGLVSVATIKPVATADPAVVDIEVHLERAPPRTIAGSLGYGTGEGATASVSWQHRNLLPPEGAVTVAGVAGTQEQSLSALLRRGNFRGRDHVLTAQIAAAHTNYQAYDARTFTITTAIERQSNIIFHKKWTWSIGTEFVATDERDTIIATGAPRRRTYLVAALPLSLGYDTSDDLLNPTRGYRLLAHVSPEMSFLHGKIPYVKLQLDASAYQPVSSRISIGGRVRLGAIEGIARDDIAPSRRFYAGGGGSVRGYGYQKIGPLDVNGDPVGGRGLAEAAIEARIRFGNLGVVPFLDAGNLYEQPIPKFTHLRYGTGLGFRYYSSFGPIRVDLGTPIDRRPGESRIAVYVSLGQAF
ncbi:translocation and assembly module TamA [Sphingomonas vulcanisoli]|uniref:Translocation and assembly module TamA n=1 Tax=Sphingomonas vulcanisoli TaxID=1658060 RepID=A0ABX0TR75_9SPHN|nr:BamA/TamA family outer membrane protein [Sphingomonas vulcanisoli]NIJ08034.1 translocation and assembly module TamA [Sphingomonas vulcanisoli]